MIDARAQTQRACRGVALELYSAPRSGAVDASTLDLKSAMTRSGVHLVHFVDVAPGDDGDRVVHVLVRRDRQVANADQRSSAARCRRTARAAARRRRRTGPVDTGRRLRRARACAPSDPGVSGGRTCGTPAAAAACRSACPTTAGGCDSVSGAPSSTCVAASVTTWRMLRRDRPRDEEHHQRDGERHHDDDAPRPRSGACGAADCAPLRSCGAAPRCAAGAS